MTVKENKISVLICEFNPLHSGHKKLIDYARSVSDTVICVMSGNFTQRAMPSVAEKHLRAVHAVKAGAVLVVELPTVFATGSAENFATGGVKIAQKLNADYLVFGSECGNIAQIEKLAEDLESPSVQKSIRAEMQNGASYPKAVATATKSDLLDGPNNTLALEYVKAIKKLGAKITPLTIKRIGNHNDSQTGEFASSSALRQNSDLRQKYCENYVTADIDDDVENSYKDFAVKVMATKTTEELSGIEGVTEGLENRFARADKTADFDTMIADVKTKRYTWMKLQRIVLSAVLGIKKGDVRAVEKDVKVLPLAVNKNALVLLQNTDKMPDETTQKADLLYASLTGKKPPKNFVKV